MSNLSANAQLLGNLEHTTAELLEGMTEERGRGFASDNESRLRNAKRRTSLERRRRK